MNGPFTQAEWSVLLRAAAGTTVTAGTKKQAAAIAKLVAKKMLYEDRRGWLITGQGRTAFTQHRTLQREHLAAVARGEQV